MRKRVRQAETINHASRKLTKPPPAVNQAPVSPRKPSRAEGAASPAASPRESRHEPSQALPEQEQALVTMFVRMLERVPRKYRRRMVQDIARALNLRTLVP